MIDQFFNNPEAIANTLVNIWYLLVLITLVGVMDGGINYDI